MEQDKCFVKKTLTEQVTEHLRGAIRAGQIGSGEGFPNSRNLAKEYGVSHNVMLKALRNLYEEGVLRLNSKRMGYQVCC